MTIPNIIGVDFEHSEQTFTYRTGTLPTNQILKIRIKKDNIAGEGLEEIHIRLVSNPVNVIGLHGIHDLIIKIQDNDSKFLVTTTFSINSIDRAKSWTQ